MSLTKKARAELNLLRVFLLEKLGTELVKQGHKATGKLLESIKVELKENPTSLIGSFEDYGIFVDTGVRNVRPGRAYIEAIIRWLRAVGIQGGIKELTSIAFAIRATHLKEGIPSRDSRKFSSAPGQRRIGWMTETLNENEQEIAKRIDEVFFFEVDVIVENFVRQSNKILN